MRARKTTSRPADPSARFFRDVWRVVRRVPRGKVATYGQIAALAGRPRAARAVGGALSRLGGGLSRSIPWQRIVNAAGRLSPRGGGAAELQRELLEREGVRFRRGRIDLSRHLWKAEPRRSALGRSEGEH